METDAFDIRQYIALLRRRWLIVAAAILVCAIAAAAISFSQKKEYTATAKLVISAQQDVASVGIGTLSDPNQLQNQVQTQVQVAKSPQVAALANQTLGAKAAQVKSVAANGVTNTRVLSISITSPSPAVAQLAANTYRDAYLKIGQQNTVNRVLSIGDTVNQKKLDLQSQINDLNNKINNGGSNGDDLRAQVSALEGQVTQLQTQYNNAQAAALVRESTAEPLQDAPLPSSPSSPNPKRNISLAIVLGALLGIGIVLVLEHFDDRLRNKERLRQWFPAITHLGSIPKVNGWKNRKEARTVAMVEPHGQVAEAYRGLRTSLDFANLDQTMQVIEVTSSVAGEGKSTTVANLAAALAWAGKSVIVVSADLRRPRIHEFFGVSNSPGITDVLLGRTGVADCLKPVVVPDSAGRVYLLGTGKLPPNPTEVLASGYMKDVINDLRLRADYVLLDAPPVLPVADPVAISKHADGILLVMDAGSKRSDIANMLETLHGGTSVPILGAVLNDAEEGEAYSYKYGYYSQLESAVA